MIWKWLDSKVFPFNNIFPFPVFGLYAFLHQKHRWELMFFFNGEIWCAKKPKHTTKMNNREPFIVVMAKSLLCEHECDKYVEINDNIIYYSCFLKNFRYSQPFVFWSTRSTVYVVVAAEIIIIIIYTNKLIITLFTLETHKYFHIGTAIFHCELETSKFKRNVVGILEIHIDSSNDGTQRKYLPNFDEYF